VSSKEVFVIHKSGYWRRVFSLLIVLAGLACSGEQARAQEPAPSAAPAGTTTLGAAHSAKTITFPSEHRFWDKENNLLFAGVAAMRTMDYFSTLNMRRRGRQEIFLTNDAVDNHAGFAFIEAGATGVSIGASYLFHRYGHHRLERWTSVVHLGLAGGGAIRNYSLKTAHF
jgi:hypothetical protein